MYNSRPNCTSLLASVFSTGIPTATLVFAPGENVATYLPGTKLSTAVKIKLIVNYLSAICLQSVDVFFGTTNMSNGSDCSWPDSTNVTLSA